MDTIDLLEINKSMDIKEINDKLDIIIYSINQIEHKNKSLNKKINLLSNKIDNIENILSYDIQENCSKMSEHIDFIDNIYENIKHPMHFIFNKVNYLNNKEIKSIESKKK